MAILPKAVAVAALMQCAAVAAMAPAQAVPEHRMTEAEAQLVQRSLHRGRLIYAYDQAAWHGTDDLKAKLPDFASKVGGWIVDGPAEAPQLVFFDNDEAHPRIVYVADFKGNKLVSSRLLTDSDDRSMSSARKAMVAARRAAIDAVVVDKARFCSKAMPNTVVLPPAAPGAPTLVYVLTPQSTLKSVPLGGHYLVEVSADGKARKPRPFTKSCMEMSVDQEASEKPVALMVTHLLDPVPTEIHVFSSLAARLPIYVSTQKSRRTKLWETSGKQIDLVSDQASR